MKIVLVSKTRKKRIKGVSILSDIREIKEGEYKGLIYHSSEGSEYEILSQLIRLSKKTKIVYVNKNIVGLIKSICVGLGVDIYDTESILDDSTAIEYIFEHYGETGMTIETGEESIETISKGVLGIVEKKESELKRIATNELWIKTLGRSLKVLEGEFEEEKRVKEKLVDVLGEALVEQGRLKEEVRKQGKELEKVKANLTTLETNTRPNMPFLFSSYQVPIIVKKVLYIKVYGECKYLLSFLSAYQHYLKMHKQYSSKLLVMMPKLASNITKYGEKKITQISPDSLAIINLKTVDFCVTFEPKKSVMDAFFKESANLFIVVDMLGGGKMLEEGYNITRYNAIGGLSDIKIFGLEQSRIISSMTGVKGGIMIPYIVKYPDANEQNKRTYYYEKCGESYKKIDEALKI